MNKKVTGDLVDKSTDEVREIVINARNSFFTAMDQLRGKKVEAADIKRDREVQKKQLIEDERTAQMFKCTKMKKKEPFLPSLKLRGYFENAQALVPIHGPNMDYRDREALIFPDRIKERSRKWKL